MQTRPTMKASLTTGGILLSGVFLFALVASTVTPAKTPADKAAATTQTVTPQASTPADASAAKKHPAGVKYSDKSAADVATKPGPAPKQ